jgi:thioester reductase-like protein
MSANNVDTICPLSPLQHGMLHASRQDRGSGLYVEQFSCVLVGSLDVEAFRAAWQAVVNRHDVLKTLFLRLDTDKPVQVVRKAATLPFFVEDGSAVADGEEARFAALLAEDRRAGFDPAVAPLMRIRVIRLGAERHRFLWTYHHAILDGWSMPVLLREVFEHLAAPGRALPPSRTDYRHYLAWLARQDVERSLAWWRTRLAGFRAPVDFAPSMAPTTVDTVAPRRLAARSATLPPAWTQAASDRCRGARITLNTLCQAAWALLLTHYGDTDDVVHGVVVSGRTADVPGIERMAGLFIGTLPVRATLDRNAAAGDWLRALQAGTQEAERHAATPLARVLSCADVPRSQPLFDTLYVFENYPGQSAFQALVESRGLRVEDVRAVEETGYGLALIVLPAADGLQVQLTYDVARFDGAAVDELLASYRRLLDRLLEIGDAALGGVFSGLVDEAPAIDVPVVEATQIEAPCDHAAPVLIDEGGLALDRAAFARAIAQGRATWTALGSKPGDRVLLLGDGAPLPTLVAAISGALSGLDVVLAEAHLPPDEARAAAVEALGAAVPMRCLRAGIDADAGPMTCERFALDPALHGEDGSASSPLLLDDHDAGSLTWLGRSPQREPLAVRHAWLNLVALARASRPARSSASRVAMSGPAAGPVALANVLRAWFGGGTVALHRGAASPRALASWLRALSGAALAWDAVQLDGVQTRALPAAVDLLDNDGAAPPSVPTSLWIVDAASLTPGGHRALARLAPAATLQRVLDDGVAGLAVADVASDGTLHVPGHARRLDVVGIAGEPVAPRALGRLAICGHATPAAVWRRGRADCARRIVTQGGPLLRSHRAAWRLAGVPAIALPQPDAAAYGDGGRMQSLERALAAVEGVREAAADLRLDREGEWALAIHVVPASPDDADGIVARVRAVLEASETAAPAIDLVARLPRDADGRVDRHALRRGDAERLCADAPAAPRDETEAALHGIWCALLKRERIGVDEDYFDLGGDSLLATVMLAQVQAATGVLVEIDALLRAPTIAGLARTLRGGASPAEDLAATLARDASRPLDIAVPAAVDLSTRCAPRDVFLTGATGFLGVHLLAELLGTTGARVHCLVRAADEAAGRARLEQALRSHALWNPAHASRIVAVPGDLGPARFGLSPEAFDDLARGIDAIYHNGAAVNFVLPYAKLKPVNVDATDEVLRLAALHRAKPVHYVSTVGVLDRAADTLAETLAVPLHGRLMGGYEQSKWVAEQRVRLAGERGLAVTIHRPSRIVGHSRTGRVNVDDLFCRLIRGVVAQGQAPYGTGHDNMLPVDLVARLVVEASLDPHAAGRAIHVVNPRSQAFDALVDFIVARGHAVERLPYAEWLEAVGAAAKADAAHPLAPLMPVLRLLDPAKDPTLARPMALSHEHLARLAPAAFADIGTPADWLPPMFEHLYDTQVLPRPPHEGRPARTPSPERAEHSL